MTRNFGPGAGLYQSFADQLLEILIERPWRVNGSELRTTRYRTHYLGSKLIQFDFARKHDKSLEIHPTLKKEANLSDIELSALQSTEHLFTVSETEGFLSGYLGSSSIAFFSASLDDFSSPTH